MVASNVEQQNLVLPRRVPGIGPNPTPPSCVDKPCVLRKPEEIHPKADGTRANGCCVTKAMIHQDHAEAEALVCSASLSGRSFGEVSFRPR